MRAFAAKYLACRDAGRIHWALIRAHRMNRPGTADGNWCWRFGWPMLNADAATWLARITTAAGRAG